MSVEWFWGIRVLPEDDYKKDSCYFSPEMFMSKVGNSSPTFGQLLPGRVLYALLVKETQHKIDKARFCARSCWKLGQLLVNSSLRSGSWILLPELGRESSQSQLQNSNCPKETGLRLEYRNALGPEVALGPLPSGRLRWLRSPCGALSAKFPWCDVRSPFVSSFDNFQERTFEVRFPDLTGEK